MLGLNLHSKASKERMPVSYCLGLVLKLLREALGLNQETVAHHASLSVVGLCRMENGLTCSAADNYERVAEALGLDFGLVVTLAAKLAKREDVRLTEKEITLAQLSSQLQPSRLAS